MNVTVSAKEGQGDKSNDRFARWFVECEERRAARERESRAAKKADKGWRAARPCGRCGPFCLWADGVGDLAAGVEPAMFQCRLGASAGQRAPGRRGTSRPHGGEAATCGDVRPVGLSKVHIRPQNGVGSKNKGFSVVKQGGNVVFLQDRTAENYRDRGKGSSSRRGNRIVDQLAGIRTDVGRVPSVLGYAMAWEIVSLMQSWGHLDAEGLLTVKGLEAVNKGWVPLPDELADLPAFGYVHRRIYHLLGKLKPGRPGGLRGEVGGFTQASRRRLMRRANSVDFDGMEAMGLRLVFGTLTYPSEFPTARASKRHLEMFRKRLEREYPGVVGLWKVEPQKRGAPHYHLILGVWSSAVVDGVIENWEWLRDLRAWASRAWYEIVDSGNLDHLAAGTSFDFVRSGQRGAVSYVAKYVGKVAESEWKNPGRWWGMINREGLLRWVKGEYWSVTEQQWFEIRRALRKKAPARVRASATARGVDTWWAFDKGTGLTLIRQFMQYLGIQPAGEFEGFL